MVKGGVKFELETHTLARQIRLPNFKNYTHYKYSIEDYCVETAFEGYFGSCPTADYLV